MLDSVITTEITLKIFLLCSAASVLLGIAAAFVMTRNSCSSQSFCITIALLPLAVQMVIMLVNGNLGAGVAVAGAFSLVRFRSVPGSAREIAAIFFAMTLGLATGMGYLGLAFFILLLFGLVLWSLRSIGRTGYTKGDRTRVLAVSMFAGMCGVLVHCYFENIFEVPYMMAYFWSMAAAVMYLGYFRKRKT